MGQRKDEEEEEEEEEGEEEEGEGELDDSRTSMPAQARPYPSTYDVCLPLWICG